MNMRRTVRIFVIWNAICLYVESCTFPSILEGKTWEDSDKGRPVTFSGNVMSGWNVTSFTNVMNQWECLFNQNGIIISKSSYTHVIPGLFSTTYHVYICLWTVSLDADKFIYYLLADFVTDLNTRAYQVTTDNLGPCDVCKLSLSLDPADAKVMTSTGGFPTTSQSYSPVSCESLLQTTVLPSTTSTTKPSEEPSNTEPSTTGSTETVDITSSTAIGSTETVDSTSSTAIGSTEIVDITSSKAIGSTKTVDITSNTAIGSTETVNITSSTAIGSTETVDITSSKATGSTETVDSTSSTATGSTETVDITSSTATGSTDSSTTLTSGETQISSTVYSTTTTSEPGSRANEIDTTHPSSTTESTIGPTTAETTTVLNTESTTTITMLSTRYTTKILSTTRSTTTALNTVSVTPWYAIDSDNMVFPLMSNEAFITMVACGGLIVLVVVFITIIGVCSSFKSKRKPKNFSYRHNYHKYLMP